jgi:hypothetical protein
VGTLIYADPETNGIKRREFLIRVISEKIGIPNLQEWPRKSYEKVFYKIFVIMPKYVSIAGNGNLKRDRNCFH